MAEYMIQGESLTTVANAIRERAGTSEPLVFPEGFKSAIEEIPDSFSERLAGTITEYSNDKATYICDSSFAGCNKLVKANMPNVVDMGALAFQSCFELRQVNLDSAKLISLQAFAQNFALPKLRLPSVESISDGAFLNCHSLVTLTISNESVVCSLSNTDAFMNTPMTGHNGKTGYIYVPRALVNSYKAATNWSTFASQIRAIEDYPDITGG